MTTAVRSTTFVVELSAVADAPGWADAVQTIRDWLQPTGATSIEAAIEGDTDYGGSIAGDRTLGGNAHDAVVVASGGERLVTFSDGRRWIAEITVQVFHDPTKSLNDLATALKTRLQTITDLEVYTEPVESPQSPAALILMRDSRPLG